MSDVNHLLRAYLVDDEALALRRLTRLLEATGRVEIIGTETDPESALAFLSEKTVDVLFLDIQMPVMNGFELLARLPEQLLVVFTTAYDSYALKAFEVNSIDYLLKPIDDSQLDRALAKLERLRSGNMRVGDLRAPRQEWMQHPGLRKMLEELAATLRTPPLHFPDRIASRVGDRIQLIDLSHVTHFFARDKLTYAAASGKEFIVDASIADLERRLDPQKFVRIHRATLVNLAYVQEMHSWFGGGVLIRLKDGRSTELTVARDRVRALRDRFAL